MPTNFTVVPVEARADGAGDEAAERTEEPGSPESADPACPTPGELGRTCNGTKAEAGPFCCRWAALAPWLAAARAARSGAMGRGQKGQLVPAWLGGVIRDLDRILGLVVCWPCSFSLLNSVLSLLLARAAWDTHCMSPCWPDSVSPGGAVPTSLHGLTGTQRLEHRKLLGLATLTGLGRSCRATGSTYRNGKAQVSR